MIGLVIVQVVQLLSRVEPGGGDRSLFRVRESVRHIVRDVHFAVAAYGLIAGINVQWDPFWRVTRRPSAFEQAAVSTPLATAFAKKKQRHRYKKILRPSLSSVRQENTCGTGLTPREDVAYNAFYESSALST